MADLAPISVLIPVRNEAANLPACLASVAWCNDIVVVDSGSTDGTPDIARAAGARVVDFRWTGTFPKKKNWALAQVAWKNAWVFIIDADERATPELEAAMRAALDALLSEPVFGEAVERAASAVLDACPYEGDRDAWGRCIALAALRAALCAPGVADKS